MKRYSKTEREAYRIQRQKYKAEWARFDAFMEQHGWKKRILFMRGVGWIKGDDSIIYDVNGWHLNGEIVTSEQLNEYLNLQYLLEGGDEMYSRMQYMQKKSEKD